MLTDTDHDLVNLRAPRYYIARTLAVCGRCHASTRLAAVALPPEHETLAEEDGAHAEAPAAWQPAGCRAFVFYVEYLPEAARRRLAEAAPGYRWAASPETFDWCWANHCEHCGSFLDDFELFCEPDNAFVPTSAGGARDIRMRAVEEPIEAAAAGYAPDPPFFDCMSMDRM